jgi:hypothetical protein
MFVYALSLASQRSSPCWRKGWRKGRTGCRNRLPAATQRLIAQPDTACGCLFAEPYGSEQSRVKPHTVQMILQWR